MHAASAGCAECSANAASRCVLLLDGDVNPQTRLQYIRIAAKSQSPPADATCAGNHAPLAHTAIHYLLAKPCLRTLHRPERVSHSTGKCLASAEPTPAPKSACRDTRALWATNPVENSALNWDLSQLQCWLPHAMLQKPSQSLSGTCNTASTARGQTKSDSSWLRGREAPNTGDMGRADRRLECGEASRRTHKRAPGAGNVFAWNTCDLIINLLSWLHCSQCAAERRNGCSR